MAKKKESFVVNAYVRAQPLSKKEFRPVWAHFGKGPFLAKKYDDVERTKRDYSSEEWADGYELYSFGAVLIRGPAALASLTSGQGDAIVDVWSSWIEVKSIEAATTRARWLEWLNSVFELADVVFAAGCTESEFEEKHRTDYEYSPGAFRTDSRGFRARDFEGQLPGIYWLTYFGAHIAGKLRKKVESVEQFSVQENAAGGLLATLKEPPLPNDVEKRLRLERSIAAQLGSDYFFDNTNLDAQKKQVPGLMAALRKKKIK